MSKVRLVWQVMSTCTMLISANCIFAQNYPTKPIRIFTAEAGGSADFAARQLAAGLTDRLGQQAIVDNRPSFITIEAAAKSPPDGYALLAMGNPLWISPLIQNNLSYNWERDFLPVSLIVTAPNIFVVHPSLPIKSVKELIALAKAKPGDLNYASGTVGGASYLASELFKAMASVNMVPIFYRGTGPALTAIISGEVQLMVTSMGIVESHIKSARLKALAVTTLRPSALAPGLPTVAETGLPGYESVNTQAVFAPAKTPAPIVNRLSQEIVQVQSQADVKKKALSVGVEAAGSSPEQLATMVKSEVAKYGSILKRDVRARPD